MEKTIEIPEGYEARIEGNKVILERKDEEIRSFLYEFIKVCGWSEKQFPPREKVLAYLERQKEQQEIPLMNGDTDLYFDEWKQQFQGNPTKRQCFEEGIRYSERKRKEQKPAEWSEEDEMHLANAILAAEKEWGKDSCTANFLKSLQPHWKPSEEQMEALDDAIAMFGYMRMADTLRDLYADLKKL